MQVDVAQEIDIDEMVALDALVSGNESRRHLITQIVKQHHGYVSRQEIKIVGFLLMPEHYGGRHELNQHVSYVVSGSRDISRHRRDRSHHGNASLHHGVSYYWSS